MSDPVRLFIGAAANNEDLESQAVLEWSIREHTSRDLDITWCQLSRDPASPWYSSGPHGWQTQYWTTPFSGFRWSVSQLCGWQGKAIYLDSDIIMIGDIGELWDTPIRPGKVAVAKGGRHGQRFCVSLWDCAAARAFLPAIGKLQDDPFVHRALMQRFAAMPDRVQEFDGGDWNTLDLEPYDLASPRTKAIHYTGIPTQLQLKHALPRLAREGGQHWYRGMPRPHPDQRLQAMFDALLAEATEAGYGIERYRREPFGDYNIRAGR